MKILLIHNFYRSSAPSGEDAVYHKEHELLRSKGHEVVTFNKFNDNIEEVGLFNRISLAKKTTWSCESYSQIRQLIKHWQPDIAHFHNTFPQISPSGYLACQNSSVPVVQTLHNFRLVCPGAMLMHHGVPCEKCLGTSLIPSIKHKCYRGSTQATLAVSAMVALNRFRGTYTKYVNKYIALTEFSKRKLVMGGLPDNKVSVKPNFIETVMSYVPDKSDYVVYVGRLTAEKGVRTLIKAWTKLPDIKLFVLGDGALRHELEAIKFKYTLNIEFFGHVPREKVLEIVSRAKIQIIPSECYEGFPNVVLEAFSCGTPVVASAIGSLNELIHEEETGLKFAAGNAIELASKIRKLFFCNSLARKISQNAKTQVETKYDIETNYRSMMKIYSNAIDDFRDTRS
jgi:glycosyltransferase involved in cell wall biosynthesis